LNDNFQLRNLYNKNRLPHSILISGGSAPSRLENVEKFLANVLKVDVKRLMKRSHPDYHLLCPEGKSGTHSIQSIREIGEEAFLPPTESAKKAFVIVEAEKMPPASANALLKVLEEPPEFSLFILLTSHPEQILPTVISRCHQVRLESHFSEKKSASLNVLIKILLEGGSYIQLKNHQKELKAFFDEEVKHEVKRIQEQASFSDKEIEGLTNEVETEFFQNILMGFLYWYRDLALFQAGGNTHLLFHSDYKEYLRERALSVPKIFLPILLKKVKTAKIMYDRSMPFDHCLESLFF